MAKKPVDTSQAFEQSGMRLITDVRSDALLEKGKHYHQNWKQKLFRFFFGIDPE